MQKNSILTGIGGLILGLAIGFYVANSINRNAVSQPDLSQNQIKTPSLNNQSQNPAVQGMMPDVQETLEKAKNEPENFEVQMKAGDMYAQIGRFDKAAAFYEQANKIKPDDFDMIVKIGNSYFDSKQYETAEKWYSKALDKKEDINVRTDLGITFIERQNPDYDRAIKEFQTALKSDPKHAPTIFNLSIAYNRKGDLEESRKYMAKLDEINPEGELTERLKKILNQN